VSASKGFYIIHTHDEFGGLTELSSLTIGLAGVDDCLNYGRFESNFQRRLVASSPLHSDRVYKWSIYVYNILYIVITIFIYWYTQYTQCYLVYVKTSTCYIKPSLMGLGLQIVKTSKISLIAKFWLRFQHA